MLCVLFVLNTIYAIIRPAYEKSLLFHEKFILTLLPFQTYKNNEVVQSGA